MAEDWPSPRPLAGGLSLNSSVAALNGHPSHPLWKDRAAPLTPALSQAPGQ